MKSKNEFLSKITRGAFVIACILHFLMISQPIAAQNVKPGKTHNILHVLSSFFGQKHLYSKSLKEGPYDVIIVPGIPYGKSKVTERIMKLRIKWACYLIKSGTARNVIFSGGAVYTPYVESRVMKMFAVKMGIPEENIFCETKARHSTENLYFSCLMADSLGFRKIALATGPFQLSVLTCYAEVNSINVSFLPISNPGNRSAKPGDFPAIDGPGDITLMTAVDNTTH